MHLWDLFEKAIKGEKGHDHFVTDIEKDTIKNDDYRRVLFTARNLQVVVMSIPPGGDIGMEVHEAIDQFIRVEKGKGKVILNGKEEQISDGFAFVVPQGTEHNLVNDGDEDLKVYTIYSPPNHLKNTVRKTKKDAEEHEEHYDGDTDVM